MLKVEKRFIESFHPNNRVAGKLLVLRRRLKIIREFSNAGGQSSVLIRAPWATNLETIYSSVNKFFCQRGVFHIDKSSHVNITINAEDLRALNNAFKATEAIINRGSLQPLLEPRLLDIYKRSMKNIMEQEVKKSFGTPGAKSLAEALEELSKQVTNIKIK
jgi:hypothetical protein